MAETPSVSTVRVGDVEHPNSRKTTWSHLAGVVGHEAPSKILLLMPARQERQKQAAAVHIQRMARGRVTRKRVRVAKGAGMGLVSSRPRSARGEATEYFVKGTVADVLGIALAAAVQASSGRTEATGDEGEVEARALDKVDDDAIAPVLMVGPVHIDDLADSKGVTLTSERKRDIPGKHEDDMGSAREGTITSEAATRIQV